MRSTLAELENLLLLSHSPEQYVYGIKYNHGQGAIHEVVIIRLEQRPSSVVCNTLPDGRRRFGDVFRACGLREGDGR